MSKHQTWEGYHKSNKEDFVANQSEIEAVYNVAYLSLKHLINQTIVLDQEVKTLAMFRRWYINELERFGRPNPNYRSENLKKRLEKDPELAKKL